MQGRVSAQDRQLAEAVLHHGVRDLYSSDARREARRVLGYGDASSDDDLYEPGEPVRGAPVEWVDFRHMNMDMNMMAVDPRMIWPPGQSSVYNRKQWAIAAMSEAVNTPRLMDEMQPLPPAARIDERDVAYHARVRRCILDRSRMPESRAILYRAMGAGTGRVPAVPADALYDGHPGFVECAIDECTGEHAAAWFAYEGCIKPDDTDAARLLLKQTKDGKDHTYRQGTRRMEIFLPIFDDMYSIAYPGYRANDGLNGRLCDPNYADDIIECLNTQAPKNMRSVYAAVEMARGEKRISDGTNNLSPQDMDKMCLRQDEKLHTQAVKVLHLASHLLPETGNSSAAVGQDVYDAAAHVAQKQSASVEMRLETKFDTKMKEVDDKIDNLAARQTKTEAQVEELSGVVQKGFNGMFERMEQMTISVQQLAAKPAASPVAPQFSSPPPVQGSIWCNYCKTMTDHAVYKVTKDDQGNDVKTVWCPKILAKEARQKKGENDVAPAADGSLLVDEAPEKEDENEIGSMTAQQKFPLHSMCGQTNTQHYFPMPPQQITPNSIGAVIINTNSNTTISLDSSPRPRGGMIVQVSDNRQESKRASSRQQENNFRVQQSNEEMSADEMLAGNVNSKMMDASQQVDRVPDVQQRNDEEKAADESLAGSRDFNSVATINKSSDEAPQEEASTQTLTLGEEIECMVRQIETELAETAHELGTIRVMMANRASSTVIIEKLRRLTQRIAGAMGWNMPDCLEAATVRMLPLAVTDEVDQEKQMSAAECLSVFNDCRAAGVAEQKLGSHNTWHEALQQLMKAMGESVYPDGLDPLCGAHDSVVALQKALMHGSGDDCSAQGCDH